MNWVLFELFADSFSAKAESVHNQNERPPSMNKICPVALLIAISFFPFSVNRLLAQEPPQPVQFGMNSFLGNLQHSELRAPTTKTSPQDRTNYLNAVRDLGITTIRETFMNWAEIEPERGKGYRFGPFDDIARKASDRGIEIVALAFPFPPWATGVQETQRGDYVFLGDLPKPAYEADFRRFVQTTVSRYCGCTADSIPLKIPIRQWIFFNEPDVTHANPDVYAHWLRIFYETVKSVDPHAKVIAPAIGTAGIALATKTDTISPTFLTKLLNSPELKGPHYPYFDILGFHCYPESYGQTTGLYALNAAYGYVRAMLRAHKLNMEIRLTETGDNSADPNLQAENDIKILIHTASVGVSQVYLQGLWDFTPPDLWGVLKNSPSGKVPVRKPSFYALQTFIRKIGPNRGVEFLGPGRYRVLLPEKKSLYILWAEGANRSTPSFLRGRLVVTTLNGKEATICAGNLKLTQQPVFVEQTE